MCNSLNDIHEESHKLVDANWGQAVQSEDPAQLNSFSFGCV